MTAVLSRERAVVTRSRDCQARIRVLASSPELTGRTYAVTVLGSRLLKFGAQIEFQCAR